MVGCGGSNGAGLWRDEIGEFTYGLKEDKTANLEGKFKRGNTSLRHRSHRRKTFMLATKLNCACPARELGSQRGSPAHQLDQSCRKLLGQRHGHRRRRGLTGQSDEGVHTTANRGN